MRRLFAETLQTLLCVQATLIPLAMSFLNLSCSVRDSVGLGCWAEANRRSLANFRDLNALDAKASLLGKQLFMTFMHCLLTLDTWCFFVVWGLFDGLVYLFAFGVFYFFFPRLCYCYL